MRTSDRGEFIKAMTMKVEHHANSNHWELVPREKVTAGTKVLDSAWPMKRKRDIMTRKVFKYEARLNVHVGQKDFGVNYFQKCSPVLN